MESAMNDKVQKLIDKGVSIPNPSSVDIGDEVDLEMISPDVTIFSGGKIYGKKTVIMAGTKLGQESPVTIQDCQIGRDVELKGGFFKKSVFMDKSNMAYGAHVRDACILEEEAGGAHTVGLKQTILLPFVTLGSLINFCDCLMAGGTSRKDHSEVGSSYIHFNYTPNQDKATASLLGDVPRGVMLDQRPIFLGGQGGIVGPVYMGFGTVIAAGTVYRGDILEDGKIVMGQDLKSTTRDFAPGVYWEIKRKTRNNINYIANIIALKAWYKNVRSLFFGPDALEQALLGGALEKLDMALDERIKRLGAVAKKMDYSIKEYQHILGSNASPDLVRQKQELADSWGEIEGGLAKHRDAQGSIEGRDKVLGSLSAVKQDQSNDYISTIQGLSQDLRAAGTNWLTSIVDEVVAACLGKLSSFR
jgi:bifunctional UDP-N-acetylglucosamine pyrophosphorylase/glucosamine-1-phosphate N-acetyltransferase